MSTVIARLREAVIGPAILDGRFSDGVLAERLIRERHEAADRIEALEAALHRINSLIDSPEKFNAEVQAVLDSVIDTSDTRF